jgi:mannose-6-phosphate isomerase-like protein (cupin superfamily)
MPVFRSGKGLAPAWCELEYFEIVELPTGATHIFERLGEKEKLIVGKGECRIAFNGQTIAADERTNLDLTVSDSKFEVLEVLSDVTLIRMCGRWGNDTGGAGIFTVVKPDKRAEDRGDPVDYSKETHFDNHYHDCDEYWILFEGSGIAVSEGKHYEVGPGDCIATGMGYHHDFPQVFEPVKAVYFETTIEGQQRRGHLWNHTHGTAEPRKDRV